jgi:[ribosomal protein S18]-alanine N-acetyltransferase
VALPEIRAMTLADLDAIMQIERLAFKHPWSRHMYLVDLEQNRMASYLVVFWPNSSDDAVPPVLAYGGLWLMVDEAHIATIASHPEWRGCGLGQYLMLGLLDQAIARGAVSSTLEVRVGNLAARTLYEKLGYELRGMRRHYYEDGEDALIMTTPSLAGPGMQSRLALAREDALRHLEKCFGGANHG